MTATYLSAQPMMARARAWEDRNPVERGGSFKNTIWHAEATAYRGMIRKSKLLDSGQRERLVKMVNLWFRHRLDGIMAFGNVAMADRLGVCRNTFRTFIRWAMDKRFIRHVEGGRGRGNKSGYVVDLGAIQEALAPNFMVVSGPERLTIEGEIDEALKGSNGTKSLYRTSKGRRFLLFPHRRFSASERLWLGRGRVTEFLIALIGRMRDNREGKPPTASKHCPAKPLPTLRLDEARVVS